MHALTIINSLPFCFQYFDPLFISISVSYNDVLVKLSCELDGLARNVARNKSVANGFGLNVDINPHYS